MTGWIRTAWAALTLIALGTGCLGAQERFDLVLRGGRVMDPETGLDAVRNVGVRDGRIVAVSEDALASSGIVHVIVGGTFVVEDERLIEDARPGQAIRRVPATF